jgi:hypothetical protein
MNNLIQKLKRVLQIVLGQLGLSAHKNQTGDENPTENDPAQPPASTVDHEEVHRELSSTESGSVDGVGSLNTEVLCPDLMTRSGDLVPIAAADSETVSLMSPGADVRVGGALSHIDEAKPLIEQYAPIVNITSGSEDPAESVTEERLLLPDTPVLNTTRSVVTNDGHANRDESQSNVWNASDRDLIDSSETKDTILLRPIRVLLPEETGTLPSTEQEWCKPPTSANEPCPTAPSTNNEAETGDNFSASDTVLSATGDGTESELASGDQCEVSQHIAHTPQQRTKAQRKSGAPNITPRQPTPGEEASEYVQPIREISFLHREYAYWNRAVVEQVILRNGMVEGVFLCITPRILASAFAEAGFDILTPDEAERRFTAAVADVYLNHVLRHSEHLRVLRRRGEDGIPDCVAFLAASVLAAYHMQSDEEASANAYYRRLGTLLECAMSGAHPLGFSPAAFESLWVFVSNWLYENHQKRLVLPGSDIGLRRFVALPLAHVPLRRLDIEKLPAFFEWAGYSPQTRIYRNKVYDDLRCWQQTSNALTQTGAQALLDDRSDAVLAQVIGEFESWDGSVSESLTRRSAIVEIQFDIVQREPILAYLARRPSGFPTVFNDGERVLEASDEGWYDPYPIGPTDGKPLGDGFEWQSSDDGVQFILRRYPTKVLALAPSSSYSGFQSSRYLARGIKCAVLCQNDLVDDAVKYLSEVARQSLKAVTHPLLPTGWSIIRDVTARERIETPMGLESIDVDPNIDLVVSGGLRTGRRWSWLAGAPPQVFVTGVEEGDTAKINGAVVEVGANNELMCEELIDQPGEYLIEAGHVRRRIEIVEPNVPLRSSNFGPQTEYTSRAVTVGLPQGSWTLVGVSPGQVRNARVFLRGALASCPFLPIWAIQVGSGPGAKVAVLASPDPPPHINSRTLTQLDRTTWRLWASVIYNANIRRPQFIGLNGVVPDKNIILAWKQYAFAAKQIKRAFKRV